MKIWVVVGTEFCNDRIEYCNKKAFVSEQKAREFMENDPRLLIDEIDLDQTVEFACDKLGHNPNIQKIITGDGFQANTETFCMKCEAKGLWRYSKGEWKLFWYKLNSKEQNNIDRAMIYEEIEKIMADPMKNHRQEIADLWEKYKVSKIDD